MELTHTPARSGEVCFFKGTYTFEVPARSDPILGQQENPTMVIAPCSFAATCKAISLAPLRTQVAVADTEGIQWRTGKVNGGNLYSQAVAGTPLDMLRALGAAAKQCKEPPFDKGPSPHLALLWDATLSVETPSFHVFRQQMDAALQEMFDGLHNDAPSVHGTIYYTSGCWGATSFTVENCKACHDIYRYVEEKLETTLQAKSADDDHSTLVASVDDIGDYQYKVDTPDRENLWKLKMLLHELRATKSPVLALLISYWSPWCTQTVFDLAPISSSAAFVQEMFGTVPETEQTHTEKVEFWPQLGDTCLLTGRHTHVQVTERSAAEGTFSVCSNPSCPDAASLRGVVEVPRQAAPRTQKLVIQFWACLPEMESEEGLHVSVKFLNDKATRMDRSKHQNATLSVDVDLLSKHELGCQMASIYTTCNQISGLLAQPKDPHAMQATYTMAHQTFLLTLDTMLPPDHLLTDTLATAKNTFFRLYMQLQSRLYQPAPPKPMALYPGAAKRMRIDRFASAGVPAAVMAAGRSMAAPAFGDAN